MNLNPDQEWHQTAGLRHYTAGMFAAFPSAPRRHLQLSRLIALVLALSMGLFLAPAVSASTSKKTTASARHAKPLKVGKAARKGGSRKSPAAQAEAYAQRTEAMQWADETANRLDLPVSWVRQQIGQARRIPLIEQLVLPAPTPAAKNWVAYRSRFIEARRIEGGVAFWQRHHATLARAEQDYGVPARIIVGIIGVETLYGQHMGNFRILDALATLAFDFPQAHPRARERQAFFRGELDHFLRLTQRGGTDPQSIRGSYAGAMGMPQFMPSSWSHYAVDFDGDGRIDLFNSPADAIGSVANYFKSFQWRPGMPTHYPVVLTPGTGDMDALLAPDILPTFSVGAFTDKGARLEGPALEHIGPLALIELRNGEEAPSYVAGTENFYAITRYNWSSYYAMAVIELGEAVAQRVGH
jgi:membrane-bound lytic murein transglycosylase B